MTKREFEAKVKEVLKRRAAGKVVNMHTFKEDCFPNNYFSRVITISNNVVYGYTAWENNDNTVTVKFGEVLGV